MASGSRPPRSRSGRPACRSRRTGTTVDRFAHRVLLEIKRDPEITVAQFLGTFKGLTSTTKRSEVAAAAGLSYKPLAALLDGSGTDLDRQRTRQLLYAMQEASRPPKPAVLGAVGKESFEDWARNHGSDDGGDPKFLAYTTVDGVFNAADIPYRWEVGFCHLPGAARRQVLIGQNFSPAIDAEQMITAVLRYYPYPLGIGEPIALFLHRITPARQTLDYGKSRLAIGYGETKKVEEALEKIASAVDQVSEGRRSAGSVRLCRTSPSRSASPSRRRPSGRWPRPTRSQAATASIRSSLNRSSTRRAQRSSS